MNESLWAGSAAPQFASLFYSILDPERGEIEYAFAGRMHAWIASPRGVRPLTQASPLLGVGPMTPYVLQRGRVLPEESLIICSQGVLGTSGQVSAGAIVDRLVATMRVRNVSADDMVERLRLVSQPPGEPHRRPR